MTPANQGVDWTGGQVVPVTFGVASVDFLSRWSATCTVTATTTPVSSSYIFLFL